MLVSNTNALRPSIVVACVAVLVWSQGPGAPTPPCVSLLVQLRPTSRGWRRVWGGGPASGGVTAASAAPASPAEGGGGGRASSAPVPPPSDTAAPSEGEVDCGGARALP